MARSRQMPIRQIRSRIFFGCEGEGEQGFAKWLQDLANQENKSIHLDTYVLGGGDPLYMVNKACMRRQRGTAKGRYVTCLVLLDADKWDVASDRCREAKSIADRAGLTLVFQHPMQEGLLLRLHDGFQNRFPIPSRAKADLMVRWPDYEKPVTSHQLNARFSLDRLHIAAEHDDELRKLLQLGPVSAW